MNTPNSPTPPPSSLFRGPYYNRRRPLPKIQTKPHIRKLHGTSIWVCTHCSVGPWVCTHCIAGPHGFGPTVGDAYRSWKSKVLAQC
jgi:hypothetical protein